MFEMWTRTVERGMPMGSSGEVKVTMTGHCVDGDLGSLQLHVTGPIDTPIEQFGMVVDDPIAYGDGQTYHFPKWSPGRYRVTIEDLEPGEPVAK